MTKPIPHYVADFETTTDPSDCRVWGWGMCDISDNPTSVFGNDIQSFITKLTTMNSVVYFHNLAFDGMFIMDWLFRAGFVHVTDFVKYPYEFSTLISGKGQFYSIKVKWSNGHRTEFRDSLKRIPMPVAAIPKAFGFTARKLEIDYHEFRPIYHALTEHERDYIAADITIVARALHKQRSEGMNKLTVGADALDEYQKIVGKKLFYRIFPVLSTPVDTDIRSAYRGGFTYASPNYSGKVVGPGHVFDVNSLYPSVMYYKPLPYGFPEWCDDWPEVTDEYPLFIASVTFTARLKKNHIPCIQIKSSPFFTPTEYQEKIVEPVTLFVTSVDLELWQDHYDLDILAFNGAYRFRAHTGFFNTYIDKWMNVKMNATDNGARTIAKLFLNALYGKFATNPDVTGKIPVFENNIVRLVNGPEEMRNPVYTPVGVFVTSYARALTIRAAQQHYDRFAYADTDSLHLIGEDIPDTLDIHPTRLGAWKHEMYFQDALFARAKTYTERDWEGNHHTHIAGLPVAVAEQVRYHHYLSGATFPGKLVPSKVPGGVVLEDVGFTLPPVLPST